VQRVGGEVVEAVVGEVELVIVVHGRGSIAGPAVSSCRVGVSSRTVFELGVQLVFSSARAELG
jgi:isopentenyl phosphate kinase